MIIKENNQEICHRIKCDEETHKKNVERWRDKRKVQVRWLPFLMVWEMSFILSMSGLFLKCDCTLESSYSHKTKMKAFHKIHKEHKCSSLFQSYIPWCEFKPFLCLNASLIERDFIYIFIYIQFFRKNEDTEMSERYWLSWELAWHFSFVVIFFGDSMINFKLWKFLLIIKSVYKG